MNGFPSFLGSVIFDGLSTVYDVGSTAYDVNEIVKDVKNAKIDDDEMMKYICAHDLAYQIKNFYIAQWTSQVFDELKRSNSELYNYILNKI